MAREATTVIITITALVAVACTPITSVAPTTSSPIPPATATSIVDSVPVGDTPRTVEEQVRAIIARSPETVTELGLDADFGFDATRLDDLSAAYRADTAAMAQVALDLMGEQPTDPDDRISWLATRWYLSDLVSSARFGVYDPAVSFITGAHANLPEFMADVHPVDSPSTAAAYVSRLVAGGGQMRQVADNLRRSARAGILPTAAALGIARWQIENVMRNADDHPLVTDFVARLEAVPGLSEAEIASLRERAVTAVRDDLLPGYQALLDTVDDIASRSDASPGVGALRDGDAFYAMALTHHASMVVDPDEVHRLGLAEVERVVGETTAALEDLGYDVAGSGFAESVRASIEDGGRFALTDDASRAEVLALAQTEIQRAASVLAGDFLAFPRTPIEVVRPRPGREGGSGAYYRAPPVDGSRPGIYYLSLGGDSLDVQTFATTNYHEAIPGHHYQLALQRESTDLPLLQRATAYSGFAEGWGLYAERLAFEAGLYDDDPSGNLGRLRLELLRAARAVADTGIHHLGWSRDDAISYLEDLGFPNGQARSEVDRYIVWPGQAPTYLVGMLEILRLRDVARSALGDDFDLAAFHSEILRHGGIPLSALDDVVTAFLE